MKKIVMLVVAAIILTSCRNIEISVNDLLLSGWTDEESRLIHEGDGPMRVLTVFDPADSVVLRSVSSELHAEELRAPEYSTLVHRMLITLNNPSTRGNGIAGPQVGVLRRVAVVQRKDKEGAPFEIYPNIRISEFRGEPVAGREGCLSVPGRNGLVLRYMDIDIKYTSFKTLRDTLETVYGFTAVLFQHECDHLDGVIYTDKLFFE